MNNFQKNLKIQNFQELTQPQIEQNLILLKKEKQNKIRIKKKLSYNNTISKLNKNNYSPYYSNVIISQNNNSPNQSVLLHEFVDDKKITYKDITNRIDMNELSSKIKNIIINIQRIKSCDKIKVNSKNNKKQKPAIYHRKTKSNFSYRQTNSSFTTTENESKYSFSVKNIFVNKNISNRNINKPKYNDSLTINSNLNNYLKSKCNNIENKTSENEKFYSITLREYLNEQVNSIKCKRKNLNENNISKYNEFNDDDHNYSIDNENRDIFNNNDNISSDTDNLFILTKTKNENNINSGSKEKILKDEHNNKTKNICKIKSKNLTEKINCINNYKISTYLCFKQNNINRNEKNKIKKKENNTFRNSHINLNTTKNRTMKNLNSNIINYNIKTKKAQAQYINCNKLNNYYIQSKPFKANSKINNNNIFNKNCKSFSVLNNEKNENNMLNNENINNINICRTNSINLKNKKNEKYLNSDKNNIQENIDKTIIKRTYENKDKRYKKRKHYSEIIRNKIHSTSQKKIKVKINNNKKV